MAQSSAINFPSSKIVHYRPTAELQLPKGFSSAMSENMSHEQYVLSVRQRIVKTAQAMLDGEMTYLLGARALATLRYDAEVENDDADFMLFVAIDSDTDDFPLGLVRELWDQSALEKLQPQIDEAENWAKKHAEPSCAKLVARFS